MNSASIRTVEWKRPVADSVRLDLPFPPSVNALWKRGRTGMYRSPSYMTWINAAGWELNRQRPGCIIGPYSLLIAVERRDNRRRDIDNLVKSISDLLQQHGVIENDSLAQSVTALWADDVKGCRVVITSVKARAA